jgi:hypothetical protein
MNPVRAYYFFTPLERKPHPSFLTGFTGLMGFRNEGLTG